MHRIISGTLLVGILLPTFVGIFPVTAQAQTPTFGNDTTLAGTEQCSKIKERYPDYFREGSLVTQPGQIQTFTDKSDVGHLNTLIGKLDSTLSPSVSEFEIKVKEARGAISQLDENTINVRNRSSYIDNQIYKDALTKTKEALVFFNNNNTTEKLSPINNRYADWDQRSSWHDYRYIDEILQGGIIGKLEDDGVGQDNPLPLDLIKANIDVLDTFIENEQKLNDLDKKAAEMCLLQTKQNNSATTSEENDRLNDLQQEYNQASVEANQAGTNLEAANQNLADQLNKSSSCISWTGISVYNCVREGIRGVFWVFNSIFGLILQAIASFFDYVIKYTILDFKDLLDQVAINSLWTIVRDLANLTFIFFLLYIALATILQINSFDTQKAIASMIVVALLINFSGVLVRIAIDISNVIAMLFYSRFIDSSGNVHIAEAIIKNSGINVLSAAPIQTYTWMGTLAKSLGILVMIITTGFVLLLSAGFFLVRAVSLMLLIILSPLAMIGYVIPAIKSQVTDKWIGELKSQLTFAPVFMMLLYLTLQLAQNHDNLKGSSSGSAEVLTQIIFYGILIGMMFACLMIARNSAKGVASSKIKGFGMAGAALAGAGVGALGSRFGGGAAQRYLDSGRGNRLTRGFANQLATRTWNPMNAVKAADKKIGDLASGKGGDFNNRSYTQVQKDKEKASKDKVENHKFNMKTMASDQVRANYIHGIKNADERKELYKSLSAQDRAKYELAAVGTAAEATLRTLRTEFNNDDDEGRNKNNKARADEHKKRIKALTTDADKATYIARIVDPDERKELYKEIDVGDRGRYEAAATGTVVLTPGAAPTLIKDVLRDLRDGLKDEDQDKTDKAESRARRNIETAGAKQLLTRLLIDTAAGPARAALLSTQTPPLDTIKGIVEAIGPNDIVKISRDKTIMDAILGNPGVSSNFTPAYLAKIKIAWSENDSISRQTVDDISDRLFRPLSGLTTLTPQQKAIKDWYETNPDMQH